MEPQDHTIEIQQQAKFYTLGQLRPDTPAIWMVVHGYGQLPQYFIRHFEVLAGAGHFIVAPGGISKFYLKGLSGRVGASWMTREDRQNDIDNYIKYFSAIYEKNIQGHQAPLKLLGFSQGVSAICRWAVLAEPVFSELVMWAGYFPEDLPLPAVRKTLAGKKISLVYGNKDPFVNPEKKEELESIFRELNIHPKMIQFEGQHEINKEVLKTSFIS